MPPHENWMDEPQGKVPHGRGQTNTQRYEREHYVATPSWEHQETGHPSQRQTESSYAGGR